jgi:hypothetical protein
LQDLGYNFSKFSRGGMPQTPLAVAILKRWMWFFHKKLGY